MARQIYNDWSPWMQALTAASDDPEQSQQPSGDFNMIEDAQRRAAATPAQPSTAAPPAHRIEDDRTAGTRGTTPQSPTTSYDPAAESRAYDPAPGRRAIARAPLESAIGKDQAELDRMNAPSKPPTLLQRIGSVVGTMATAGRGEGAMEQAATLRDRAEARKQQERESLGSRISANARTLSQQEEAEARLQEQEEFQRGLWGQKGQQASALEAQKQTGRIGLEDVKQEGRESLQGSRLEQQYKEFQSTDQYRRWKTQLDNAAKLHIAQLRQQAAQNKAPAALMQTAVFADGGIRSLNDAERAMQKLEQSGIMGQSWAQNKAEDWVFGKGAVDPSVPPEIRKTIGELRTALNLAASAMTRAHTQRGSKEVYDDLKQRLGPGQDWSALRGAISESQDMLGQYVLAASDANIANIRAGGTAPTSTPAKAPPRPPGVPASAVFDPQTRHWRMP